MHEGHGFQCPCVMADVMCLLGEAMEHSRLVKHQLRCCGEGVCGGDQRNQWVFSEALSSVGGPHSISWRLLEQRLRFPKVKEAILPQDCSLEIPHEFPACWSALQILNWKVQHQF